MNTEQFHHNQADGYTAVVDVDFTRDDLIELLKTGSNTIYVQAGFAYLHPNDNYCKEIGRNVARENKGDHALNFFSVSAGSNGDLHFQYRGEDIVMVFKTSTKSQKPHFIFGKNYDRPSY